MSKKVLIFSLVYYPEFVGGAEVSVREITDRILPGSFDMVTLIGKQESRFEKVGNINVFRVGFRTNSSFLGKIFFNIQKYLFPFIGFLKGIKLMKKNKYDIVWSIMANYAGFATLFFKFKFPKVKFLLTLQEGDPIPYIKRRVFFVYPLFKLIFRKADSIQTISNYLAGFAKSMGGKNIKVLPNGVDIKNFTKDISEEEKFLLKEKLKIKNDDIVLITTSRLVIKNGIENVINTLSALPEKYKFLIIGTGYLKNRLEKITNNLKIKDRVYFLGFVPHKEIPSYFSISNIFIRTSLSEGLGNSFLEAMAFGLPVVATPVGGIVDFIKDGETGILVSPQDIESINKGILRLEDNSLKNYILANAKNLVLEKYDWDKISEEFKSMFIKL